MDWIGLDERAGPSIVKEHNMGLILRLLRESGGCNLKHCCGMGAINKEVGKL